MREILFRGKVKDTNSFHYVGWCYGGLIYSPEEDQYYIVEHDGEELTFPVDSETIGQYTGRKDKNGTKIFEGDIFGDSKGQEIDVVVFEDGCFKLQSYGFVEYCLDGNAYEERWSKLDCEPICNFCLEHDEILGNIYDNPELLEVAE